MTRSALKSLLFFPLFQILTSYCVGQSFRTSFSNTEKFNSSPVTYKIPGGYIALRMEEAETGAFSITRYKAIAVLSKYDENMHVVSEQKLSDGKPVFSSMLWEFKKVGESYWLFYMGFGEKWTLGNLFAVEIDPVKVTVGAPRILLSASEIDQRYTASSGEFALTMQFSPDGKLISFFCMSASKEFFLAVFDDKLNLRWSKREPRQLIRGRIQSTIITNKGEIYQTYKREVQGYVVISSEARPAQTVAMPDDIPATLNILLVNSTLGDTVFVAGTYGESFRALRGVFKSYLVSGASTLGRIQKVEFPDKLVEQFHEDGWASKKEKRFGMDPEFHPKIMITNDGIVNITGEFSMTDFMAKGAPGYMASLLNIRSDSPKPTFTRIPKMRVTTASRAGNYFYTMPHNDKLIIFYNDHAEHLERDISLAAKRSDNILGCSVVAAVIEKDGTVSRKVVFNRNKESLLAIVAASNVVSKNSLQVTLQRFGVLGVQVDNQVIGVIELE
jgi:hypothetical protein